MFRRRLFPRVSGVDVGRRPGPVGLVLLGIASVQVGASIAKGLFDEISPTGMVWLRLVTSALVLTVVARPVLRGRNRGDWAVVVSFGLTLAVMNWAIYESFARIPLGVAVTVEFIGPLTLAVVLSRRVQELAWVGLAGIGVAILGFAPADLDLVGIALALVAGAAWAGYILLSVRTGRRWSGLDGLAVASMVAALVLSAPALVSEGHELMDLRLIVLGTAVGLLSSVIPYASEMVALRSLPPAVFGVLMSLEPAAAALAAMVLLHEVLSLTQWFAVGCVVLASIGSTRSGRLST
jgi:inner membrane transporter RhtA